MKFDEILSHVGDFGTFQKRVYINLLCGWILTAPFMLLPVFILTAPDHRCTIPGLGNDTYEIQGESHQKLINKYIPKATDEDKTYDQCSLYTIYQSTALDNDSSPINATKTKCSSWVYSKDVFGDTFIEKVNLVCDDKYKTSLAKSVMFGGVLAGSLISGFVSDLLGRRTAVLICTSMLFVSASCLALAQSFVVFVIIQFFMGVFNAGMFLTVYVLNMEWVGPSSRTRAGIFMSVIGSTWSLYLTLVAYFVREWHYITLASSIPVGIYTVAAWFLPESPRWLCTKKRFDEAHALLKKAADVNKRNLPDIKLEQLTQEKKESGRVWLLFTSKRLCLRTLVIFYNWMVISMIFYGLSLNTGILYGNYYINFLINVLVEFPGHALPIIMIDRFGRKKSHVTYMLVGGLSCISTIFTVNFGGEDLQSLTTALAMLGKFFATAGFAAVYVFSVELFPTAVRNAGIGSSSSCARIGAMISPFIASTTDVIGGKIGTATPLVIFGSAALVAGGLALTLPETLNQKLPDSIEDGKNYGNENKSSKYEEGYKDGDMSLSTKL